MRCKICDSIIKCETCSDLPDDYAYRAKVQRLQNRLKIIEGELDQYLPSIHLDLLYRRLDKLEEVEKNENN